MGQGRNAVFLAMQGWDVTGFDPSDEGVRLAQASAAKAGVKIRALVSTDDQFDFGVAQWDLIVMTYIRSPAARDVERIQRALAPGGIFVYENGSDRHNELLKLCLTFRILRFEDVDAFSDWNPAEKTRLERLVADTRRSAILFVYGSRRPASSSQPHPRAAGAVLIRPISK
jgi:SAM-dependent methyltransferase